jgi:mannose-1-phosphate guanylyltransferase/phosphomannomutase
VIDYSNGVASTIFPNILGSLQCQALALNAYLDPKKLTRDKVEFDAAVTQLSQIVTSLGYDIGFLIDAGAEKIFVVDENGNCIKNDRLLSLITSLFLTVNPQTKKIAVPITASAEIDLIVKGKGVEVVKTRDSHLSLMEASTSKDVQFVGGTKGGFIFPDFLFASDGMYSVAKILEMMALAGKRLGTLDKEVPALHLMKRSVHCPWDRKGKVMRHMMHDTEGMQRVLVDGIKIIFENDVASTSVLMRPDKAEPLFHVSAESTVKETALSLLNKYEEKILRWRDLNES